MGISQVPAPAIGRNWVEIGTTSSPSGSTISFTSLASYQYYRIRLDVELSTSAHLTITLNNSTSGYISSFINGLGAWNSVYSNLSTSFRMFGSDYTSAQKMDMTIDNTSTLTTAKAVSMSGLPAFGWEGAWLGSNAQINRIDLSTSTGTFSSGTIKIFGSN